MSNINNLTFLQFGSKIENKNDKHKKIQNIFIRQLFIIMTVKYSTNEIFSIQITYNYSTIYSFVFLHTTYID